MILHNLEAAGEAALKRGSGPDLSDDPCLTGERAFDRLKSVSVSVRRPPGKAGIA
jgi:hypothetical protein